MHKHWPEYLGVESLKCDAVPTVVFHPQQSWHLMGNKVVLFDGSSELPPDGTAVRSDASAAATTFVDAGRGAPTNAQCWEAS
jgi:uncharacterized protein DUF5999